MDPTTCAEYLTDGLNVTEWNTDKDLDFVPSESVVLFDMYRDRIGEKTNLPREKWKEYARAFSTLYKETIEEALKIPDSVALMVRSVHACGVHTHIHAHARIDEVRVLTGTFFSHLWIYGRSSCVCGFLLYASRTCSNLFFMLVWIASLCSHSSTLARFATSHYADSVRARITATLLARLSASTPSQCTSP